MFTAETVKAEEALRIGLCEKVVPDDRFEAELASLAKTIMANSGFSHAANKRLLEATDARPLDAGLQWEVLESEGVGPDMQERIAAFNKK
jgi:enoyl-CoA hydratase